MLCCVFFGFVLTCVDLRKVVDTIARVCSTPPSIPQPCAVAMLNHYDQRLSWSKIRLQEKSLNSSLHPRLLTRGSQHWRLDMIFSTNTHPQKCSKVQAAVPASFFLYFTWRFTKTEGFTWTVVLGFHMNTWLQSSVCLFSAWIFFLFFKNQLWLNYVLNKYSIVCVLKCPALMHFWIIGILTPGSQLLLHTPE